LGYKLRTKNRCTEIFDNVWCPILGKPTTPLCHQADRHGRKKGLDCKL